MSHEQPEPPTEVEVAEATSPRLPELSDGKPEPQMPGGIGLFFSVIGVLALVRVLLGFITLPLGAVPVVSLLVTVAFLAAPILAIFYAANHAWKPRDAVLFLVVGFLVHAGFAVLDRFVFQEKGVGSAVANALAQAGLSTWTVGMGALLATMIRERNILIPVAIFLAIYDAFLVLTPIGFTQVLMQTTPLLQAGGAQVPKVTAAPTGGKADVLANIGPADFVFMGAFFVALFRFRMQTKRTLQFLIPLLLVYLLIVLTTDVALPALVPIGLAVLAANWKEFKLTKDEWISTAVVAVLGLSLLIFGATRPRPAPKPQAEPSTQAAGPEASGSGGLPKRASGD